MSKRTTIVGRAITRRGAIQKRSHGPIYKKKDIKIEAKRLRDKTFAIGRWKKDN